MPYMSANRTGTAVRAGMAVRAGTAVRAAAALLAAVAGLAALSACDIRRQSFEETATSPVRITEIQIEGRGGTGDVVVQPGDPSQVQVRRTVTYRGDRPDERTHEIEASVLRIRTRCQRHNCGVSYAITAPRGVRILGENGSGDLRVSGVSTVDFKAGSGDVSVRDSTGTVDVRAGSGKIELVDVRGPAKAEASSGDIQAFGVRSTSLTAETSSGNLRLELVTAADVRARTSSGDIRLVVPAGDYRVNAVSDEGNVDVRVRTNPKGGRTLNLETRSGDIAVNLR